MKKGFTLIEVLIVVIILGILATLALPQFVKMTKRARLAEAWASLGGIRTAEGIYYMEKDKYAITIGDLDFDTPTTGIFTYSVTGPAGGASWTGIASGTGTAAGMTAWLFGATGTTSYKIP